MIKRLAYGLICLILIFYGVGCSPRNTSDYNSADNVTRPPASLSITTPTPTQNTAELDTNNVESYGLHKSIRFVVLADSRGSDHGVNSEIVKAILGEVKKLSPQPEFAIMPGDLIEGSKEYKEVKAQLDYFKHVITEYYPIRFFYPGIGNHEMKAGKKAEKAFAETFSEFDASFLKGYNKTSYYIDAGDIRIFMLNSNHPNEKHKITGKQLDWIKSNMDQSKKYHFFMFHEPPYPTGSEEGNSLDSDPASRNTFWKVVDSLDNSIVICGHEHNYSRRLVDSSFNQTVNGKKYKFRSSVYQIITGGFGAPLYKKYTSKKNLVIPPVPQYHYTVVDINEDGLNIQAINLDGEIIDSFKLQ